MFSWVLEVGLEFQNGYRSFLGFFLFVCVCVFLLEFIDVSVDFLFFLNSEIVLSDLFLVFGNDF